MIETGTQEGVLESVEQRVALEALRLGERTVRDVMRPRIDLDALDVNTPPEEVIGSVAMAGFSRLPVYEGDLDHVIGFVHIKDLFRQMYLGWDIELRKLLKPALFVPESMPLDRLLELFQEQHNQLAVVLDEYGGTEGMVTLEDVIEELVGEIREGHQHDQQHMFVERGDNSWLVDGTFGSHRSDQTLRSAHRRSERTAQLQHHFRSDSTPIGPHSQRRRHDAVERPEFGSGRHGRPAHRPGADHSPDITDGSGVIRSDDSSAFTPMITEFGPPMHCLPRRVTLADLH